MIKFTNVAKTFRKARVLDGISLDSLMEGHKIPRKAYKMSETASMIARMFPARLTFPSMGQHAAL